MKLLINSNGFAEQIKGGKTAYRQLRTEVGGKSSVEAFFNEKLPPPQLSHGGVLLCISRARILRQFFEKGYFQRVFVRNR